MKKIILILFISKFAYSQKWFPKLTPEQDLTFDYYSNCLLSYGSAKIINHYTHKPLLSGFCGVGLGVVRSLFERGLSGKIVSNMGGVSGGFVFTVDLDQNKRKKQQYYYKRLSYS